MSFRDKPHFNVGASPNIKRQKEFMQPVFRLVDVLPGLSRQLRLDEKAKELSVMSLVDHFMKNSFDGRFLGQAKASHMQFKGEQRILIIDVRNGMIASELGFYTDALLQQVNQYASQTEIRIDQIKLRVSRF